MSSSQPRWALRKEVSPLVGNHLVAVTAAGQLDSDARARDVAQTQKAYGQLPAAQREVSAAWFDQSGKLAKMRLPRRFFRAFASRLVSSCAWGFPAESILRQRSWRRLANDRRCSNGRQSLRQSCSRRYDGLRNSCRSQESMVPGHQRANRRATGASNDSTLGS